MLQSKIYRKELGRLTELMRHIRHPFLPFYYLSMKYVWRILGRIRHSRGCQYVTHATYVLVKYEANNNEQIIAFVA